MDAKEYQRLYKKISEKLQAKRHELERVYAELHGHHHILVDALNTLWRLENDKPHPAVDEIDLPFIDFRSRKSRPLTQTNGNAARNGQELKTRNDVIRHVVRRFAAGDVVTTQLVMDVLEVEYPDVASQLKGRTTILSKVLRSMEERGELEKETEGIGFNPTIYRRAANLVE